MATDVRVGARFIRGIVAALMAGAIAACGSGAMPPGGSASLDGTWTGENVMLTVTDTGAVLERPCATGELGPLTGSTFSVAGIYRLELGPSGEPRPALYTGSVAGDTMKLDVLLTDTSQSAGSFTLMRGGPIQFPKCL